jgi:hypothetical protein
VSGDLPAKCGQSAAKKMNQSVRNLEFPVRSFASIMKKWHPNRRIPRINRQKSSANLDYKLTTVQFLLILKELVQK